MFEELMTLAKNEMRAPELILYLLKNRILMHLSRAPISSIMSGVSLPEMGFVFHYMSAGVFQEV